MTTTPIDRRTVLLGSAVVGAGAVLTACGGGSAALTATAATGVADSIGGAPAAPPAAVEAGAVGPAAAVPVGGGVIYANRKVVVTQPTAKVFKAFSAVCTHQGCTLSEVKPAGIVCNCHGSTFSITDGSVLVGPATDPLKAKTVTESGGVLTVS